MAQLKLSLQSSKISRLSYVNEIFNFYHKSQSDDSLIELCDNFPEFKSLNEFICNPSLRRLFNLIMENLQNHSDKDAIFFVDKLITLTDAHPAVVYLQGECYYNNGDYKKVHSLFVKHKLLNYNQNFQLLAARSLVNLIQFAYKIVYRFNR